MVHVPTPRELQAHDVGLPEKWMILATWLSIVPAEIEWKGWKRTEKLLLSALPSWCGERVGRSRSPPVQRAILRAQTGMTDLFHGADAEREPEPVVTKGWTLLLSWWQRDKCRGPYWAPSPLEFWGQRMSEQFAWITHECHQGSCWKLPRSHLEKRKDPSWKKMEVHEMHKGCSDQVTPFPPLSQGDPVLPTHSWEAHREGDGLTGMVCKVLISVLDQMF